MKRKRRPTLADVARHAEVSSATVSRALRETGPVSQDLRQRIEASMIAVGYTPRGQSRNHPDKGTLALIVGDLLNPYFLEIAQGVQDEADSREVILTLYHLTDHPQRQQQLLQKLSKPPVDGIILAGLTPFTELLTWQKHHKTPVVILNRRVSQPGVHCIVVDFESAMIRATQHLLALGHTRIGHLASPSTGEIAVTRQRGIQTALTEAGLALRPEWCPIVPPGRDRKSVV